MNSSIVNEQDEEQVIAQFHNWVFNILVNILIDMWDAS